ncbi:MAG: hypothetical protein AB7E80_11685 [Hyphomicrobiaceae bacterium]
MSAAVVATIAGLALAGCAGGPTPEETAALAAAPIPAGKARVMIERPSAVLYAAAPATIELNGQKVASVGSGGSAVIDVPAGANKIAASAWSYPGTWTLPLEAQAGQTYKVIVEPRGSSFGPSLLGPIGGAIDAASNDNAGAFQMRIAQAGGV